MIADYSVGIPVRNEEKTIVQTIDSVLAQTLQPREIHVCVNGSSDSTYDKVMDVAKVEKSINVITSEPGKANAWNKIVSESIDNKILFCDGDVIINPEAAEKMFSTFDKDANLVLVGGSNAYYTTGNTTVFSRYFTENVQGKPIKQKWVCGRLYMTKVKELYELAEKLEIELMPSDIINEDGFLELITSGHRQIIDSAYNLSMQVATFHDWKVSYKRIVAGQKQLKERYPHYFGDSDFSIKRLKNYVARFKEIEGVSRKIGVASLFMLRTGINLYFKFFDGLDYSTQWKETTSTKTRIEPQ